MTHDHHSAESLEVPVSDDQLGELVAKTLARMHEPLTALVAAAIQDVLNSHGLSEAKSSSRAPRRSSRDAGYELAEDIVKFALQTYNRGRKRSAPHCVARIIFELANSARVELAEAVVVAAQESQPMSDKFEAFFKHCGDENYKDWPETLRGMIESGVLASLGPRAQGRVTTQNDDYKFFEEYKAHVERDTLLSSSAKKARLALLGTVVAAVFSWGEEWAAAATLGASSGSMFFSTLGAKWIFAIFAVLIIPIAAILFLLCNDGRSIGPESDIRPPDVSNTAPETHSKTALSVKSSTDSNDGTKATRCNTRGSDVELKRCFIRAGDQVSAVYVNDNRVYSEAVRLYRMAIDIDCDTTGFAPQNRSREAKLCHSADITAYERLAAIHAEYGRMEDALQAYRAELDLSLLAGGSQGRTKVDGDCFPIVALERRVRGAQAALDAYQKCRVKGLGPTRWTWGPVWYEAGLAARSLGAIEQALQFFAQELSSLTYFGLGANLNLTRRQVEFHLSAPLNELMDTTRQHTIELLKHLEIERRAAIQDGFAVWSTLPEENENNQHFYILAMPLPLAHCLSGSSFELSSNTTSESGSKPSYLKVLMDGREVKRDRTYPFDLYWSVLLPRKSNPYHFTLNTILAEGCYETATDFEICLYPDGRFETARRCQ